MELIEVENLIKSYPIKQKKGVKKSKNKSVVTAVDNITFSVKKGECIGFLGPNGAGKSTTIKMLSGILLPTAGKISITGNDPFKKKKEFLKKIGVVFGQRSQLWWDLPAKDSFEILKAVYDIDNTLYKKNLELYAHLLNLEKLLYKPVRQMRLGEKMRCEIAASFLHNPEIVFLDEPTIGLDILAKDNIRKFIKYLNKNQKVTFILTSHDMDDIENICNRLIIIDKGKIVYQGTLDRIKDLHGKKRYLKIVFDKDISIINPAVKLIKDNGREKTFVYDLQAGQISKVLQELSEEASICDLEITSTTIETVIKDIYIRSS